MLILFYLLTVLKKLRQFFSCKSFQTNGQDVDRERGHCSNIISIFWNLIELENDTTLSMGKLAIKSHRKRFYLIKFIEKFTFCVTVTFT